MKNINQTILELPHERRAKVSARANELIGNERPIQSSAPAVTSSLPTGESKPSVTPALAGADPIALTPHIQPATGEAK